MFNIPDHLFICASPRASHDQTSHMRLTQNDTRNRMNVGPNANSKEKFIKSTKNRRHGGVSEAVLTTSQRPRGRPAPGVSDASDASDPPLAPSWPPSSSDGDQSSEHYAPSTSLSRAKPTGSSSATEVPVDPCDIFSVNNTLSDHTPRPQDCHPLTGFWPLVSSSPWCFESSQATEHMCLEQKVHIKKWCGLRNRVSRAPPSHANC